MRQFIWFMPGRSARLTRLLLSLPVVLTLIAAVQAHDTYDGVTTVTIYPDRLELILTLAPVTALRLIDPAAGIPSLTPENIATHRPRLIREAATLFSLTSGRTSIASRAATSELTDENDLVFHVTYPRPPLGRLDLTASYLKKLGDGYGTILEINDHTGHNLGWEQLFWSRPDYEVIVPTAPPAAPSTPPPPR